MSTTADYEKSMEHQFDSYCKTVVRNQARTIYAEQKRWQERFVSLESLTSTDLSKLCQFDTYDAECTSFPILYYQIPIQDVLVSQALESLSPKQRDIILLSFFIDMKDIDIAFHFNLAQSTVNYHKKLALEELWTFMEEHNHEP